MVKILEIKDLSIKDLLMYIGYRAAIIRGEITNLPEDKKDQELNTLTSHIESELTRLGGRSTQLSERLLRQILNEGYYLDIHQNNSNTRHPQNIYLGHIIEKRVIDKPKEHTFLVCHSKQYGCFGAPYPDFFQPQDLQVYTNKDITWIDFKRPVNYSNQAEYPQILSKISPIGLEQLKIQGKRNYDQFPNKTDNEPSLN